MITNNKNESTNGVNKKIDIEYLYGAILIIVALIVLLVYADYSMSEMRNTIDFNNYTISDLNRQLDELNSPPELETRVSQLENRVVALERSCNDR